MSDALTAFRRDIEDLRRAEFVTGQQLETLPSLKQLAGDELDILGLIADRLSLGKGIYGQWVASADLRDLERESLDEELDDVIYRAMRTVKRWRGVTTFAAVLPLSQEEADHIRARLEDLYRGPRTPDEALAAADLCRHTGHAGGRDGHIALIRGAQPWWKRWLSR